MVDLGMSPMDAIKSATSRAAEMLDMTGQVGVVAPGAYADMSRCRRSAEGCQRIGEHTIRDEGREGVQG